MVLLSFFIGNDFAETAKIDRILPNSPMWQTLQNTCMRSEQVSVDLGGATASAYKDDAPSLTDGAFLQIKSFGIPLFQKDNPLFDEALSNTMAHLLTIKKICDLHGIRLSIVLIPDEMQVDDTLLLKVAGLRGIGADQIDTYRPNRALSAELTRLGIDHLDLLPIFRVETPSGRLYKPNDTHWNIRGNAIAERVIFDHVLPRIPIGARQ